ncbi:MAG: response regulator [Candidatus Eremiobacteraeota bacterium]|nr:response regulator [Candidatus Eremiobacteraeota bacterium]
MRVLVADDAAAARAVAAHLLRSLGHEVCAEAEDAGTLTAAFAAAAPDVVLLDGRLPPEGGLAALRALLATSSAAKVLVVAAIGESSLVRDAMAAGASGVVRRPLLPSELAAAFASGARTN